MKRITTLVVLGVRGPGAGMPRAPPIPATAGPDTATASRIHFTYTVTTTDNGSCGTPWATDTVKRTFLRQEERGRLVHADASRQGRVHDDRRCEPRLVRHDAGITA